MKSWKLNFLEPSGPLQASNGTDLPFLYLLTRISRLFIFYSHVTHILTRTSKLLSPLLQFSCSVVVLKSIPHTHVHYKHNNVRNRIRQTFQTRNKEPIIKFYKIIAELLECSAEMSVIIRRLYDVTFTIFFFFERERERGHPVVYYQICIIYYAPSIHNIHKKDAIITIR